MASGKITVLGPFEGWEETEVAVLISMELLGCSTVAFCWFSMSWIGDLWGTVRHS